MAQFCLRCGKVNVGLGDRLLIRFASFSGAKPGTLCRLPAGIEDNTFPVRSRGTVRIAIDAGCLYRTEKMAGSVRITILKRLPFGVIGRIGMDI